jgi:hypothetical protein
MEDRGKLNYYLRRKNLAPGPPVITSRRIIYFLINVYNGSTPVLLYPGRESFFNTTHAN